MKPQRFEIGQEVTPKVNSVWVIHENICRPPLVPRQGEIYHVLLYCRGVGVDGPCIELEEAGAGVCYMEDHFEPLITTEQLEKMMEPETATITI